MMNAVVVGYGAIGPVHAHALNEIPEVTIYGICDIIKERADEGAKKYNTRAFYDFDECVKDDNVDFIHICTPHYLHFEMITKALDNGKRVVVEKPAVMTKEQLDIVFEKYDTTKIFPIIQNRTNKCIEELKKIVSTDKTLGELKGIKGVVTWKRDANYYNSGDWRGTVEYEGGGVLINQSLHTLDLMVYFGGDVESVSAGCENHSLKNVIEVEDTLNAFIRFKNGAKGIFFATNAYSEDSSVLFELHFENKKFIYYGGNLYQDGNLICSDTKEFAGKSYWGNGHIKTLTNLYQKNSKLSLKDVKETMNVLFSVYDSCKRESEVILER